MKTALLKARNYSLGLPIALGFSALTFTSATIFTQSKLSSIEESARKIAEVAAPSLEYLARTREPLGRLSDALETLAAQNGNGGDVSTLREPLQDLHYFTEAYLQLPLLPHEREKWEDINSAVEELTAAVQEVVHPPPHQKRQEFIIAAEAAIRNLNAAIPASAAVLAETSQELARGIDETYLESRRIVILLEALSLVLTFAVALSIYRIMRRHEKLLYENARLLKERVAELDIFSARVAHDIKNPLSTITAGVEVLEGATSPDEIAETIAIIKRSTTRAFNVVDELLLFARAGSQPTAGERAQVKSVLEELATEYRPIVAKSQIQLTLECPNDVEVACGPGILASIVENLLRNAVKYMGTSRDRRISLKQSLKGSYVRIEVTDTGPGIPESTKQRLFEPFFRGAADKTEDGIGLGLATVKRLVEAYGGNVAVRSAPGAGSTFCVDLPRPSKQNDFRS